MTRDPTVPVILRAQDQRKMPWKNGLGVTTEIMVHPANVGLTDFDWRVSMATVSSDGAFSSFTGIDRTLTVLTGDGLILTVCDAAPIKLTTSTRPYSFPADSPAHAALIGRPVTDLNVMTRRNVWKHKVTRLSHDCFPDQWFAKSENSIWFCTQGEASFIIDARCRFSLQASDAVYVGAPRSGPIDIVVTDIAELVLIELNRV